MRDKLREDSQNRLSRKRSQVLRFCRKNKVTERSVWFGLAKKKFQKGVHEKADLTYSH